MQRKKYDYTEIGVERAAGNMKESELQGHKHPNLKETQNEEFEDTVATAATNSERDGGRQQEQTPADAGQVPYHSKNQTDSQFVAPKNSQENIQPDAKPPQTNSIDAESETADVKSDAADTESDADDDESKAEFITEGLADLENADSHTALAKAEQQIEELKQAWSRERADFQNYRKRLMQEKEKDQETIICRVIGQFLPVLDNIRQMAQMETASEEIKSYITGVDMIRKSFIAILQEHHIYEIHPTGEEFDPLMMEAIASDDSVAEKQIDQVTDVFQSGFFYQKKGQGMGQIIRPARVKVGKAAENRE